MPTQHDISESDLFSPGETRVELACALYARGKIGKVAGAEMAGVDFFEFQKALSERGIVLYSDDMLTEDVQALKTLFPS